ncbi:deoxyribose-phosphate aldolase [Fulvivirgaceae bacterium BMA12]|uniref:Deoxyribose-phosphate aldolase n=1 Tax=Agaribacillus aureus TaxID=3051825 RepID=A0ABT8LCZ7_9BACT|nr:deoxyribose-phosphate aldolase [Fulvivirgaceae bacterium BMA12]
MENINNFIEQTNLRPTLIDRDIDQLVEEARKYHFAGICVPPFWVKKAKREIGSDTIRLVTVIGFPLGYQMSESKTNEMEIAIANGADELDMVMNVSAFKSGMPWVKIEIAKCAQLAHDSGKPIKIIIETAYLSSDEMITAAKLCQDAGADYVKTSTGFAPSGAKVEDIRLLRSNLANDIGIKASGGIKSLKEACLLIEAGADRIGTSGGVKIMEELAGKRI